MLLVAIIIFSCVVAVIVALGVGIRPQKSVAGPVEKANDNQP